MSNTLLNTEQNTGHDAGDAPLISVLLPIYNVGACLPKCMSSLFAQTYSNLEFVLIDDGSTDGSGKLCDEYTAMDARVVVYHKPNGGLSDARNYGIVRARGAYITCVDPDDYVDADYIEYLYNLVQKHDAKMAICQHRVWHDDRVICEFGTHEGSNILSAKDCIERMLYHNVIDTSAWGKLYASELFRDVQYPVGKQFEDIATTYKLMGLAGEVAVGRESKYNYILRDTSIVNSAFNSHKLDLLEMTDGMARDVVATWPDLEDAALRRRVYARFSTLNQMLYTREYPKVRREIIRFIRENSGAILKNPKAPRRDKLAILTLQLGFPVYRWMWKAYSLRR